MTIDRLNPATLEFIGLMTTSGTTDRSSAELILDTNVFAEMHSVGDLLKVIDEAGLAAALLSNRLRYRRHRMKHSLILAWCLSRANLPAAYLGAEGIELMTGTLSPTRPFSNESGDSLSPASKLLSFRMTTAFVHIIRDLVLGSWHLGALLTSIITSSKVRLIMRFFDKPK
jgi:hypothetical protein